MREIYHNFIILKLLCVILLSSLNGIRCQTPPACSSQLQPVAKACTPVFAEGNTVYYDASLLQNEDCNCEFNTTSAAIQVSPLVQPPLDLCSTEIVVSVDSSNPFFNQVENMNCLSGTELIDTTVYNSGSIIARHKDSFNIDANFCLEFKAQNDGDKISIKCTESKENLIDSTPELNHTSSDIQSSTLMEGMFEGMAASSNPQNITSEARVGPEDMSESATFIDESSPPTLREKANKKTQEITTMFPGAFSTSNDPILIEPISDFELMKYFNESKSMPTAPHTNTNMSHTHFKDSTEQTTTTRSTIGLLNTTPNGNRNISHTHFKDSTEQTTTARSTIGSLNTTPNGNRNISHTHFKDSTEQTTTVRSTIGSLNTTPNGNRNISHTHFTEEKLNTTIGDIMAESTAITSRNSESPSDIQPTSTVDLFTPAVSPVISSSMFDTENIFNITSTAIPSAMSEYLSPNTSTASSFIRSKHPEDMAASVTPASSMVNSDDSSTNLSVLDASSLSSEMSSTSSTISEQKSSSGTAMIFTKSTSIIGTLSPSIDASTILPSESSSLLQPTRSIESSTVVLTTEIPKVVSSAASDKYSVSDNRFSSSQSEISSSIVMDFESTASTSSSVELSVHSTISESIKSAKTVTLDPNMTFSSLDSRHTSTETVDVGKLSPSSLVQDSSQNSPGLSISDTESVLVSDSLGSLSTVSMYSGPTQTPETPFISSTQDSLTESISEAGESSEHMTQSKINTYTTIVPMSSELIESSMSSASYSSMESSLTTTFPESSSIITELPLFDLVGNLVNPENTVSITNTVSASSQVIDSSMSVLGHSAFVEDTATEQDLKTTKSSIQETTTMASNIQDSSTTSIDFTATTDDVPTTERDIQPVVTDATNNIKDTTTSTESITTSRFMDTTTTEGPVTINTESIPYSQTTQDTSSITVIDNTATESMVTIENESETKSTHISDTTKSSVNLLNSTETSNITYPISSSFDINTEGLTTKESSTLRLSDEKSTVTNIIASNIDSDTKVTSELNVERSTVSFSTESSTNIITKQPNPKDTTAILKLTSPLSTTIEDKMLSLLDIHEAGATNIVEIPSVQDKTSTSSQLDEKVLTDITTDGSLLVLRPKPVIPLNDTPLETPGQIDPHFVDANIGNEIGRVDLSDEVVTKKPKKKDIHKDSRLKNKTVHHDHEQLDKDTVTVIVIGSIIGVVVFIAIIVILVTFLKARKGSGELPEVNEKGMEMNGGTKGIDNPLIQLEQETSVSEPILDPSGKSNGHTNSSNQIEIREDMNQSSSNIDGNAIP